MRLPVPNPAGLIGLAVGAMGAAQQAIALVPRVVTAVGQLEGLVGRVRTLVDGIEVTHARVDTVIDGVEVSAARTQLVIDEVEAIGRRTDDVVGSSAALVTRLEPAIITLEPTLNRFAETTSPAEVAALVRLLDALPELVDRLRSDVLPILDTLGTVAPDVHDLLEVSRQLNEMLGGIPGLGRIKKRVEDEADEEASA